MGKRYVRRRDHDPARMGRLRRSSDLLGQLLVLLSGSTTADDGVPYTGLTPFGAVVALRLMAVAFEFAV